MVRLKSGDPGIFGRLTEELDAARAAKIKFEIVPGVTAVSAAGAASCPPRCGLCRRAAGLVPIAVVGGVDRAARSVRPSDCSGGAG